MPDHARPRCSETSHSARQSIRMASAASILLDFSQRLTVMLMWREHRCRAHMSRRVSCLPYGLQVVGSSDKRTRISVDFAFAQSSDLHLAKITVVGGTLELVEDSGLARAPRACGSPPSPPATATLPADPSFGVRRMQDSNQQVAMR